MRLGLFVSLVLWGLIALAVWAGMSYAQHASTGYRRCAIVDPYANKVVQIKQSSEDTIIRVIGYVDNGDTADFEGNVWNFAAKMVTNMQGTTLRERCVMT